MRKTPFSISRRHCLAIMAGAVPAVAALAPARAAQPGPSLRRGINIHNALNWPDVTHDGGGTQYRWPAFADARFQVGADELRRLSELGFDFIRLTVDPSIFIAAGADHVETLDAQAVDLVRRMQDAGFSVVFDLHPVAVNPDYAPARLMAKGSDVFPAYCDLVERLAGALDRLPHEKTAFELMNEPLIEATAELPRWQPMLETLHARARNAAPQLPLVLSGAQWSSLGALKALDTRPFADSNVFYTFHYYDPHTFTHQGVLGDDAQYLADVPWPMTRQDAAPLVKAARSSAAAARQLAAADRTKADARTGELVEALVQNRHDPARVAKDFASAADWARSRGVATNRVLLGEFGCVAAAHGLALGPDRLRWIEAVRRAAEANGMPWAYWAYKGWGGMEMVSQDGRLDASVLAPLGLRQPT